MNIDDKISAILRAEADTVEPSPAGYDAIREGIAKRRRASWWLRGSAFTAAALSVAAVAFVVRGGGDPSAIDERPATSSPSVTGSAAPSEPATPSATPSPTVAPPVVRALGTVWPLTTTDQVERWHGDHSRYPALENATATAKGFARAYLHITNAVVEPGEAPGSDHYYAVYRPVQGDDHGIFITTVRVRGFGAGGTAPYLVMDAKSDAVSVAQPGVGATVTSPLEAKGPYQATDTVFTAALRGDERNDFATIAQVRAKTGPPQEWSAALVFEETRVRAGSFLVTGDSGVDGGLGSATAVPVTFDASVATPPGAGRPYVGVSGGSVLVMDPGTGKPVRTLYSQGTGTVGWPSLSPDGARVAWDASAGTCSSQVMVDLVTDGERRTIAGGANVAATSPAWLGNGSVAYLRTACGSAGDRHSLNVHDLMSGRDRELRVVPDEVTRIDATPDGKFVTYWTETTITTVDVATGKTATAEVTAGCRWRAVDTPSTTAAGHPLLITGRTCDADNSRLVIDQRTTVAADGDQLADVENDAMFWRLSYDAGTKRLLVSHGVEDAPPWVELLTFGQTGTAGRVGSGVDQASW